MSLTASTRERLEAAWARTDALIGLVDDAHLSRAPIAGRPPLIHALGHLPAFAFAQVCAGVLGRAPFEPAFDDLFLGPEPADGARWPSPDAVRAYRDRARDEVRAAFDAVAGRAGDDVLAQGGRIFHAVLEHEALVHEDVVARIAALEPGAARAPEGDPGYSFAASIPPRTVTVPGGEVVLGASFERVVFGWDHEFPPRRLTVGPFRIDAVPVTNGEFMEFVDDGGYERRELWSTADWRWKEREGVRHPAGWDRRDGAWVLRTPFDELPLPRVFDWPVSVSAVEAEAYCAWRGGRLPTEAEFQRAAYGTPEGGARSFPWGEGGPNAARAHLDLAAFAPVPVGSRPAGASAFGVHELVGNGWEWTQTTFAPHPGFLPLLRTLPGWSTERFDGTHRVALGASWASAPALVRRSFRLPRPARDRHLLSKFRCVRPAD